MKKAPDARLALGAAVFAAALAAHAGVLGNGFTNWDDPFYVLETPREPAWAARGGLWQPLTWLSIAADRRVWGDFAGGHHLTSLLLHAATALLLYLILLELLAPRQGRSGSREAWAAALGAALWAAHPLRVESVAWASERKGVLSAFFCAAALLAHLRGFERAALAAFAAGLASKATAAGLPVALAALTLRTGGPWARTLWNARRRLAPWFLLSAAAVALNAGAARASGGRVSFPGAAWLAGRGAYGFLELLRLTLWPSGLAAYHPPREWFADAADPRWLACVGAVAAAAVLAWRVRRSRPGAAAAAVAYAGLWLPMSGLVQHGLPYSVNERFSLLPAAALSACAAWAFAAAGPAARAAGVAAAGVLLGLSMARSEAWRDSGALWEAARASDPSPLADLMLGSARLKEGLYAPAAELVTEETAGALGLPEAYEAAGQARLALGDSAGAERAWRLGLARAPSAPLMAHLGTRWAEGRGFRARAGARLLEAALLIEPGREEWTTDLAAALERRGETARARALYESVAPRSARARLNLGLSLARAGRFDRAEESYRSALADSGVRARAHHNLALLRAARGRMAEAERHYRLALRAGPLAPSAVNLANLLARRGDLAGAEALYLRALALDPSSREAVANLAAVRAALGR